MEVMPILTEEPEDVKEGGVEEAEGEENPEGGPCQKTLGPLSLH